VGALARARDAGDEWNLAVLLPLMADLDLRAGRTDEATRRLHEALQLALRTGTWFAFYLDCCGHLCAATVRHAEAVTAWAAWAAHVTHEDWPGDTRLRQEPLRAARQALGPGQAQTATGSDRSSWLALMVSYCGRYIAQPARIINLLFSARLLTPCVHPTMLAA